MFGREVVRISGQTFRLEVGREEKAADGDQRRLGEQGERGQHGPDVQVEQEAQERMNNYILTVAKC